MSEKSYWCKNADLTILHNQSEWIKDKQLLRQVEKLEKTHIIVGFLISDIGISFLLEDK